MCPKTDLRANSESYEPVAQYHEHRSYRHHHESETTSGSASPLFLVDDKVGPPFFEPVLHARLGRPFLKFVFSIGEGFSKSFAPRDPSEPTGAIAYETDTDKADRNYRSHKACLLIYDVGAKNFGPGSNPRNLRVVSRINRCKWGAQADSTPSLCSLQEQARPDPLVRKMCRDMKAFPINIDFSPK